jgi:hypothetical protein
MGRETLAREAAGPEARPDRRIRPSPGSAEASQRRNDENVERRNDEDDPAR